MGARDALYCAYLCRWCSGHYTVTVFLPAQSTLSHKSFGGLRITIKTAPPSPLLLFIQIGTTIWHLADFYFTAPLALPSTDSDKALLGAVHHPVFNTRILL